MYMHTHTHTHTCSLTQGAQQALRCTMEKYTNTTRFALACNTSSMIIEALQSRCAILRYQRLTDEQILDRLHAIIAAEKVCWSLFFSSFSSARTLQRLPRMLLA
nr:replication factor small subunit [Pandoravirus massiliensis]